VLVRRDPIQESHSSAVQIVAGNDLFAGFDDSHERSQCGHAARKGTRIVCTFQVGELFFKQCARRIAAARVVIFAKLGGGWLCESRGLIDRRNDGAMRVIAASELNASSGKLHATHSCSSAVSLRINWRRRSNRSAMTASVVGQRPAPWPEISQRCPV